MSEPVNYQQLSFNYVRHPDQQAASAVRHPVVIVGAGPVGLALAIDLAQHGQAVVLLDNDNTLSSGSRAICFAKRTLEIFDRLGCGDRMVAKGVSWNIGKVFFKSEEIYRFDLLPESGHERPAFINLQQYYVEGYLAERASALPLIDMRWKNAVTALEQHQGFARLTIQTPDGAYQLDADHVAACDGYNSTIRKLAGQEIRGRSFKDRFLIADIKLKSDHVGIQLQPERWFWFDPDFHPRQSVLLHRQPDDVWRIDFQLGWDADPVEEKKPENIIPRVKALLGDDASFDLEWASVYTFACQRMASFRHGRVMFAGDSAHGVSPFGARGANSGVQDAENLGWKIAYVLQGKAGEALLDSYCVEREYAADENILNSTRSTDFITPKSEVSLLFRDAVLQLSKRLVFARTLVNSGRLSMPSTLDTSPLNTPDIDRFSGKLRPGAPAADAPITSADGASFWLLKACSKTRFTLLVFGDAIVDSLMAAQLALHVVRISINPLNQLAVKRYDAQSGALYLLRPDQHVCARWRALAASPNASVIRSACARARALPSI
jgi:3-(3-hydroxy-phenyl)propionate hydroxylase